MAVKRKGERAKVVAGVWRWESRRGKKIYEKKREIRGIRVVVGFWSRGRTLIRLKNLPFVSVSYTH